MDTGSSPTPTKEKPAEALHGIVSAWPLALIALGLAVAVFGFGDVQPHNLLYGASKVAALAYLGHWVDRWIFPETQAHTLEGIARGAAERRKSWVVGACILVAGMLP